MKKYYQLLKEKISALYKKGAFHIVTGAFLSKFIVFFGSVFVVRALSKVEYGQLSYVENLYGIVYLFAGLGMVNSILRYVVLGKNIEKKKAYYNYFIKLSISFNILLVILFFIINLFYVHPSEMENTKFYFAVILLLLPFQNFVDSEFATERAMFNNKAYAMGTFTVSVTIIIGKCIGAFSFGVIGVILITIGISIVACVYLYLSIRKKYFDNCGSEELNLAEKKETRIYAIQYMITNSIWTLFLLSDIFLIGKVLGDPILISDYKIALIWPSSLSILCSAIGIFVAPYFIKNENNNEWVWKNYKKIYIVNFIFIAIVSIIMWLLAKPLIFLYGGAEYYNVIPLMRFALLGTFVNNGLRYTTANLLAAMGKIKYNLAVSLCGIIIQICMNLYMLPRYGLNGVIVTSIIVYFLMAIVLFIVFVKKYRIRSQSE